MDQHTNERRFDRAARRNQAKANALTAIAETLLITATLAAGIAMYELMANTPDLFAVTAAIATAFGANGTLTPMFTAAFGPTINRLRGLTPKGADQR
ncbi:hypothetical protein [Streptomyces sp. NPDC048521]|uniref:hypothetical protein n=1 Tax=Streptomyces sp. NPDC048521 TaxID=3365566 RepID=UPI00370F9D79